MLAFRSTGIYPLNQNWSSQPENLDKFKICPQFSQTSTTINEQRFQKLLDSFQVEEHIKRLNYVGQTLDLSSPRKDNNHENTDAEGFLLQQTLSQKVAQINKPEGTDKERKRKVFESQTDARILNTNERLEALEVYLKEKKLKSNKDGKLKKEEKIKVDLSRESDLSSYFSSDEYEENSRGFFSSLGTLIPGLQDYTSEENISDNNKSSHSLYLPFSNETGSLICKKKLIIFLFFIQ